MVQSLPPGVGAALGYNGVVVQFWVAGVVVRLDVVDVNRRGHARHLVHVSDVGLQVWELAYHFLVALEVANVHWVESDQGDKEAQVRLCELAAGEEALAPQALLAPVQRLKQLVAGCVCVPGDVAAYSLISAKQHGLTMADPSLGEQASARRGVQR